MVICSDDYPKVLFIQQSPLRFTLRASAGAVQNVNVLSCNSNYLGYSNVKN
ncbi:hypothetical protein [Candidatus Symbiopectobacterium sp.]|uniref:hypothetical protein n=1 Tax=Candidatus Symbiopectobacterium sp. TaxID=2816440 RepID=UPI0025BA8604|nr:hypothetical protein [Candidatus Symbiopectobacterium sp.]